MKGFLMTALLSKLVEETSKLPEELQEAMAAQWLEELKEELAWDERFKNTQNQLAKLADQARSEVKAGKYRDAGFDEL